MRLLVVDDSALMRKLLGGIFEAEADFTVEFARSGTAALAMLPVFQPDVITLDIHMPDMDGLTCLDHIMVERPCPVVMVSSLTAEGASQTLDALQLGAVDFITKPLGAVSLDIHALAPRLVEAVRRAAQARLRPSLRLAERIRRKNGGISLPPQTAAKSRPKADILQTRPAMGASGGPGLVLVGTSTGGPPALDQLLSGLPASFPWPVVIAQHMPATFTGPLARRLDTICNLAVSEVTGVARLTRGNVYIGRGEADLLIAVQGGETVVMAAPASPDHPWHPSVDRLVDSALLHIEPSRLLGVLMTGMGNDGAAAMTRLKALGGHTVAEAEETAVVWGMPGELVRAGGADAVIPVHEIASYVVKFLGGT